MFARCLHNLNVDETYDIIFLVKGIYLILQYDYLEMIANVSAFFNNFKLIVVMFVVHISFRHPGELFWFLPRNPFIPLCNIVYSKRNKLLKTSTSPE